LVLVECPVEFDDLSRAENDSQVAYTEKNGKNKNQIHYRRQFDFHPKEDDRAKYLQHKPRYYQRNKNTACQMENDSY